MKQSGILAALAATTAILMIAAPAQAALLNFSITGDYTANFQLDSNPAPDEFGVNFGFVVWDVPGFPDTLAGKADVYFFHEVSSLSYAIGGMTIYDFYGDHQRLATTGPQVYSGPESAPTFSPGTFVLVRDGGPSTITLTISPAAAVPEPASWALMIGGLGLVGGAMRRRMQGFSIV